MEIMSTNSDIALVGIKIVLAERVQAFIDGGLPENMGTLSTDELVSLGKSMGRIEGYVDVLKLISIDLDNL